MSFLVHVHEQCTAPYSVCFNVKVSATAVDCGMPSSLYPDDSAAYVAQLANTSQITNTSVGAQYAYSCRYGYFVNDVYRTSRLDLKCQSSGMWEEILNRTCEGDRQEFLLSGVHCQSGDAWHTFSNRCTHVHLAASLFNHSLIKNSLYCLNCKINVFSSLQLLVHVLTASAVEMLWFNFVSIIVKISRTTVHSDSVACRRFVCRSVVLDATSV